MTSLTSSPLVGFHTSTTLRPSTLLAFPASQLFSLISRFVLCSVSLLTSRIFVRGTSFDIHIQGLPHEISRDIACHGTAPSSVSTDGTGWVSLGYIMDQRMDLI